MSSDKVVRKEVVEFLKEGIDIVNKLLNKIAKTANPKTRQGVKKTSDLSGSAAYCLGLLKEIMKFTDIYSTNELKEEEIKKMNEVKNTLEKIISSYPKSNKGNFFASRSRLSSICGRINQFRENFYKLNVIEIENEMESFISSIHSFSDEESFEFQVQEDERQSYKAIRKNKRYF